MAMGLFTILLLIVIILAIIGLGWKTFSSAVLNGFEKALNKSLPLLNNLTQYAREFVNNQKI
jgi:hypothetical protein